ncbi:hypothetical protein [Flavobacterium sp. 3HN19-14]|uniref:hypothetical protein n=1 Tax=Flavobacterium sp. 3HN19-14 TaxID=3448133 RepID=UPI003EDF155A
MKQLAILLLLPFFATSQVESGQHLLKVHSILKTSQNGVLIVRTSLTSATDTTTIVNPNGGALVISTIVYNDGVSELKPAGYYFWNGANWTAMNSLHEVGDLKYGLQLTDHSGWYLLNGRAVSTLPASAQSSAAMLGFATNLPDATDKFLKGKGSSETLAATVGSNLVTITQANLPNFNMSATTSSDGSHTHTGTTTTDGAHTHSYDGYTGTGQSLLNLLGVTLQQPNVISKTTGSAGSHSHTLNVTAAGAHSHNVTINSGGSGTATNNVPSSIVTNVFIYLGN